MRNYSCIDQIVYVQSGHEILDLLPFFDLIGSKMEIDPRIVAKLAADFLDSGYVEDDRVTPSELRVLHDFFVFLFGFVPGQVFVYVNLNTGSKCVLAYSV